MKTFAGIICIIFIITLIKMGDQSPHAAEMMSTIRDQEVPRVIDGADLLVDLAKLASHQVTIKNVHVYGTNNNGALGRVGGVTVKITTTGIDTESFRYMLKNCTGGCDVHLLATPTGETIGLDWPMLADVKIVE